MTRIVRLAELPAGRRNLEAIDAIFFESSATREFASEAARFAFRQRWLGRYLEHDAELTFVAVDDAAMVLGYVVGAIDNPALAARFGDIGFFAILADELRRFPAHLHINLTAAARSQGIGPRLIGAFAAAAADAGAPGVHVVTGASARNVAFYRRNGFDEVKVFEWSGSRLVMLGRPLSR